MPSATVTAIGPRLDETELLIAALREITWRWNAPERRQLLELAKAVRLSPTLEVCEALCRGEKVPLFRLDPGWAKAYGLR